MDTKETKLVAHEEDQLERVQYFDGALYYHTGYLGRAYHVGSEKNRACDL